MIRYNLNAWQTINPSINVSVLSLLSLLLNILPLKNVIPNVTPKLADKDVFLTLESLAEALLHSSYKTPSCI